MNTREVVIKAAPESDPNALYYVYYRENDTTIAWSKGFGAPAEWEIHAWIQDGILPLQVEMEKHNAK